MEYVKLGNSDLRVSRICLGCMGFGDPTIGQHSWTIGEEPTRQIIRRALDLGVNFFDTAIAYQLGTSEHFVGRALRDMARREDVVVATKFLPRTDAEIQQGINGQQHVLNNIDSSLQHLGMDYVDLYIYHIWDYRTPAEEILQGMNEAVRMGKARYIGIANVYAYQLARMNALAEKRGWAKFVSVQNHYNLILLCVRRSARCSHYVVRTILHRPLIVLWPPANWPSVRAKLRSVRRKTRSCTSSMMPQPSRTIW